MLCFPFTSILDIFILLCFQFFSTGSMIPDTTDENELFQLNCFRFNMEGAHLHAASLIVKKDEVLCANEGWLYGSFHVLRPITPDDADGRLLLRNLFGSAGSVLIAKSQCSQSMVYEALVDSVEESRVIVKLSVRCCEDLGLTNNSETIVDVQFRINRLRLCEMHDNIDRLGLEHIRIVFPAFGEVALENNVRLIRCLIHHTKVASLFNTSEKTFILIKRQGSLYGNKNVLISSYLRCTDCFHGNCHKLCIFVCESRQI